jgi:hypothetical protein
MNKLTAFAALFCLAAAAALGRAEDRWGEKLFAGDLVHDFGTVAHGADLYYRFKLTNPYKVPLDIDLKVSCGCVTATSPQRTLQPNETSYIEARMDTTRFTGVKQVTVYVSIGNDSGYHSSAELKVSANIRQDVVFNPGQVEFGAVNQGETVARTIDIDYAGGLAATWKITEVVTNNGPVEATLKEVRREGDRVGYQAVITLKKDAPVGALKQEILFKTNDTSSPFVPAFVLATIQSSINVSPSKLDLGNDVVVGSEIVKRVVVRSGKAVKIVGIEGTDEEVRVDDKLPTDAADSHRLTIRCKLEHAGDFKRVLKIRTDGQDAPVEVQLEGTVQP